ncbi:MAG: TonB-dependent receptor [Alteromonadales bacterium]|nr:TonB-dependent receptor [Alteromonadales bacterium]
MLKMVGTFSIVLLLNQSALAADKANENKSPLQGVASIDAAPSVTEVITITGNSSVSTIEFDELTNTLAKVPGGVNLVNLDALKASQSSLAKVLDFEPGVIVQEFFGGNDQPRINIRGSGIQDNPVNRGIQLLDDGMALNQADGSFIIGLVDPEQAKYISIYRGANAMRYGGTTLGGAMNFISRKANNSDSLIKLEAGSFGFKKAGLSIGQKFENLDYYLSAAHSQADGFRAHSEGKRSNLAVNFGYYLDHWKNRTYVKLVDNQFNMPFILDKERAETEPSSIMGETNAPMDILLNIGVRKPYRHSKQIRVAHKVIYQELLYSHQFSIYGEQVDDSFKNPLSEAYTQAKNYGIDYSFDYSYFNEQGDMTLITLFTSANKGSMPREFSAVSPTDGQLLAKFADIEQEGANTIVGAEVIHDLTMNWQVVTSLQWIENKRAINDVKNLARVAGIADQSSKGLLDSTFTYRRTNPKVGIIYSPESEIRYYANISSSSEAPNFWQLATVAANPNDPLNTFLFVNDLSMQTANTFEFGGQQQLAALNWQVSYYYSAVDNELISVVGDFAVNGKTINYQGRSIHQGVEFGANFNHQSVINNNDQFNYKLVYNYSDFYFDNGQYQGKSLAGVPVHLMLAEIAYQPRDNINLSIDMRWQPIETYVDHANTKSEQQDTFLLIGLKGSYQPNDKTNFFIEIKNISDEIYQTSYAIRGQTAPGLPTFIPGVGRSFSAGIEFKW